VTATSHYVNWWKENYISRYDHQVYMKGLARSLIYQNEDTVNYFFGLINETLPASYNPYSTAAAEVTKKIMPIVMKERPDIVQKLRRGALPFAEIVADITKISKPVSS
jgi:hypothetical protein